MAAVPVASVSQFALLAGVSRTTVYRWMRNGLDYWTADVRAIKVAHLPPALVFGPGWFGLAESDQETAA
jgi:predicted DNA-binding transcriptional regulator AlpA